MGSKDRWQAGKGDGGNVSASRDYSDYEWRPAAISLIGVMNVMLRHRHVLIGLPTASFLLVVGLVVWPPRTYTSSASFMPQSSEGVQSVFSGLAEQFGVNLPSGMPGRSPYFYAELLQSRRVLNAVVEGPYSFQVGPKASAGGLIELYDIEADSYEQSREAAVEVLRDAISVRTDPRPGLVRLSVTAQWAPLAEQIAQRMLVLVNKFDLESRRTQAAAEREFIEGRVDQGKAALREAENALQQFLQQNQGFRTSSGLSFQHDRLQRVVLMQQQVYTSLVQWYERAKIDEVRNTPVITLVELPHLPVRPDRRGLILKGLLAIAVGALLGVLLAFGRDYVWQSQQREQEDFEQFVSLRKEMTLEVWRVWGWVARPFRWLGRRAGGS